MRVSNKFCEGNNRQQPERRPATAGPAQFAADAGDGGGVRQIKHSPPGCEFAFARGLAIKQVQSAFQTVYKRVVRQRNE